MSSWTCTACAGTNPAGTAFCGHCGQRPPSDAADVTWTCRDCGSANPSAMRFCGRCGGRRTTDRQDEVRLVTALFADVSGFTALADALDTEGLHEVLRPLVSGLAQVAERYGGFLEKYAGDALLAVYGAPVTREDDAQRALATALDMHAQLPDLLRDLGPAAAHLTVHIGVNTGRVIAGRIGSEASADYGVLGDSVILAQRLESVCPAGQTYVGRSTWELARDDFDLEPVGEVTVKGKAQPVEAYRLLGRRSAPAPADRPLVGRDAELRALSAAVRRPGLVHVEGDAGAGKSRLLAELRARAQDDGVQWLPGRCLSYGASLPYWPFADLLRHVTGSSGADDPAEVLARWQEGLPEEAVRAGRRLLGTVEDGDPRTSRREVHEGIRAWLAHLAQRGPVVLCVEDAHWVDAASRELLAELVHDAGALPLTVVATTRPGAQGRLGSPSTELELRALDGSAAAGIAAGVLGAPAGPALAALLVQRTSGNALFVEQLAAALRDTGALVRTSAGWDLRPGVGDVDVPTTVERVFATRLDALPPPAAGVLQLMAVVGRTARRPLLERVAAAEDVSLEPLDRLVAAGLVVPAEDGAEPAVAFAHALLQDVVYGRLLRKRRRELHGRVADAARALYGERDETIALLARHLWLAGAGADAADALLRAGRRAAALYANEEAATHLERAVEVLEAQGDPRLAEVRLELAAIDEVRAAYDRALLGYERALESCDEVRAQCGRASVLRKLGRAEAALEALDEALTGRDATSPDSAPLWLERGWSLGVLDRQPEAVAALRAGLDACGPSPSPLRSALLLHLARALAVLGELDEAEECAHAALDAAPSSADDPELPSVLNVLGDVQLRQGRLGDAHTTWSRALEVAERVGHAEQAAGLLLNLGLLAMQRDAPAEAVALYRRAVAAFERMRHGSGRAVGYANLAECLLALGEVDEADAYCARALVHATEVGQVGVLADALRTLAGVCLRRGDLEAAAEHATRSADLFAQLGEPGEEEASRALVPG